MGNAVTNAIVEAAKAADHDYVWSYTDEPHATRRKKKRERNKKQTSYLLIF